MTSSAVLAGLAQVVVALRREGRRFALVGGVAVSVRAEPRFTRDLDLALMTENDRDLEGLVLTLRGDGYEPIALVEHEARGRLATARLASRSGLIVDLLAASSGIEDVVVGRATDVDIPGVGNVHVARAEELLALKVLAVTPARRKDEIDAVSLILANPALDLDSVREDLRLIRERGFDRKQDLEAKLAAILVLTRLE